MTPQALDYFLPSLSLASGILTSSKGWTTPHCDVLKHYGSEHLAGGRSIGLRAAEKINFLMVDIDLHADKPTAEQLETHQTRIELLETNFPGLLFRSSNNYNGIGRQYYIPLSDYTETEPARRSLRNILISIGYPGAEEVEIFPSQSHAFRLPFGAGNRPMPGGKDTLAETPKADQGKIFNKWLNGEMQPLSVSELLTFTNTPNTTPEHSQYTSIPEYYQTPVKGQMRAKNTELQTRANPDQLTGKQFFEDPVLGVNPLLAKGITTGGIRYRACNALAFYFITCQGMNKDQAERELITWIDAKHNGQSSGYNANKRKAYADIKAIIRGYDETKLKAHRQTPHKAAERVQFSNSEQIQFANALQQIALNLGRKHKAEYIVGLPYALIMKDERFRDRAKISRCLAWARNAGLIRRIRAGLPGVSGSIYTISAAIVYGKHQDTIQDDKQAKVIGLVKREGSQKAAAELLGVSANMISKVLTGKTPVPAAWFEGQQVTEINQIHTLLNKNLFVCELSPLETKEKGLSIPVGIAFESVESGNPKPGLELNMAIVKQSIFNRGNYALYKE